MIVPKELFASENITFEEGGKACPLSGDGLFSLCRKQNALQISVMPGIVSNADKPQPKRKNANG
jgi:hypothetical protein